jgi:hypothetical protein
MQRTDATLVVTSMLAAALILGTTLVSCGSDDGAPGDTVDGAAAVTALVTWAAEELPVV